MRITRLLPAVALAVALAVAARGETIELRSGATIVGSVQLEGPDDVVIDAVLPSVEILRVKRADVTPSSLHAILDRAAGPTDAAKRRELGEYAEQNGFLALAVADYAMAKKLDAALAKDMDARITRCNEMLAGAMLLDAEDQLAEGKANAALMYLHTLRERYPSTQAAKKAEPVAAAAHKAAGASAEVAVQTVAAEDASRVADQGDGHLAKGDAETAKIGGHVGSTVAAQRAAERAVGHYESAWGLAKSLPVAPSGDEKLDARVVSMRETAKRKLVGAYLTAGTILLERRVVASAEQYCNLACELDPENRESHRLHELILQAKILAYRAGGSR